MSSAPATVREPATRIERGYRALVFAAAAAAALWLGQEVLSSGMLATWITSPTFVLWGSVLPPLFAAWLWIGGRIRSGRDWLFGAVAAGAGSLLYEFAAAHLGHPLHGSSWALKQPWLFWTLGPVAYAAAWALCLLPYSIFRRRRGR